MTIRRSVAPVADNTRSAACESDRCRAAILWVKTDNGGKWMPVDRGTDSTGALIPVVVNGERRVHVVRQGEQVPEGMPRMSPHWTTCPDAELYRDTRTKTDRSGDTPAVGRRLSLVPSVDVMGECAGCLGETVRFGRSGRPLCPTCVPVLEAWRSLPPAERKAPIPYAHDPTAVPRRPEWVRKALGDLGAPAVAEVVEALPAEPPPAPARILLVVDGPSLAHRAHYGFERSGLRAGDGSPIWALHGFAHLLAACVDRARPARIMIGWDGRSEDSERRRRWPEYKAQIRGPRAEDLTLQLAALPRMLTEAGLDVVHGGAWEADDVLASASAVAVRAGLDVVLATSDRDATALVSERVTLLRLVNGTSNAVMMGPAEVLAEYGVTPAQYPDLAALRGDASDNVAGVPGYGAKTAVKLLATLGSVEAALAAPSAAQAAVGRAAAGRLATAEDAWRRSRAIMALRDDLPVDLDAARLPDVGHLAATLRRWGVEPGRLAAALHAVAAPDTDGSVDAI